MEAIKQTLQIEEELDLTDVFEENLEATSALIQRLIATRRAQLAATDFRANLEDLEAATSSHTGRDYSSAIANLTTSFQHLRSILNGSVIETDHPLRRDISLFKSRLHKLSSCEKGVTPTILPISGLAPARAKPVQLPKITLPTFDGNLMNWSTFWSQFRAAVDANKDLTGEHKLVYLRDAIQDPSIKSLMFCGAEREGLYDEVVELLCRRFDKKRLIHSNYCKNLTEMSSVKSTRPDLHHFVDTVRHSLAGLRHTDQYDLPSFLTSTLVPCLSKALQVEWEVHTKESRIVPPVEDFLEFVMFRADVLYPQPMTTKGPQVRPNPLIQRLSIRPEDTELLCTPPLHTQPTDPTSDSGMSVMLARVKSIPCFNVQNLIA